MMQKTANYFSTAYILLMFCVYPFYMENGYYNIGEAKMHFFMKVSLAAFFVLTVLYLMIWIKTIREKLKDRQAYLIDWERVSAIDLLILLYGTTVFLSYVFSANKEEALLGAEGWYMGLIPQLLLCALYFLISRLWAGSVGILYPIMVSSAVVFVWGIGNRFSFYPIIIEGFQSDFISTLGNINWFCGFMSVTAPLGVAYFVVEQGGAFGKRLLLGGYAFLTFATGFAQGSDSVFLWFGAVFFLLFWIAAGNQVLMRRGFTLLFLWAMAAGAVKALRIVTVDKFNYDIRGVCGYFVSSNIFLWIAAAAVIGYLWFAVNTKEKGLRIKMLMTVVTVFLLWMILSIINTLWGLSFLQGNSLFTFRAEWGHGRGATFWAGIKTFSKQPFLQKLIGVGPDCFASAAYRIPEIAAFLREYFGSARLTNAHNECLTTLVNTGILGACSYMGFLFAGLVRYLKAGKDNGLFYIFGVSIAGYLLHNMISFAQVLNIPFLFIVMGMAEAKKRHT